MKLTFNIDYRTNWGESVYLCGGIPTLGDGNEAKAMQMLLDGDQHWSLTVEVDDKTPSFEYFYVVRHDNGYTRKEWGTPHRFERAGTAKTYEIFDRWQDQPWDKPYYSQAFTNCICKRTDLEKPLAPKVGMINIRISAPMIQNDEVLAIGGSCEALGNWDPQKALILNDAYFPEWEVNVDIKNVEIPFEYKFIILKRDSKEVVAWEGGDNRRFDIVPAQKNEVLVYAGMRFINPLSPWRGAGVAIPVFSLRTNDDFGVGEFYDLKEMVDWAVETGQKFIQLLPINDTTITGTWTDSYPYKSNTSFALHPMYLHLPAMGKLKDAKRQAYFDNLAVELNKLPEVDYEQVNNAKNAFTRELFQQEGDKTLNSAEFKEFVKANDHWLTPYAAFSTLRDINGTVDMDRWGDMAVYTPEKVAKFTAAHKKETDYYKYLQYHLDKQMHEVIDYAHSKGVALKGDVPIGVARHSADAWTDPRLFNLDCQAGAPPDDFSIMGQNWGFPTYNWEEMNLDGFAWWKARFRKMAEYFDAYRIDHVLGFFRIWQIPSNALHGLLGYFNPALPFAPDELKYNYDFWIDVDLQTKPYIMDYFLHDFFGDYTDEVREKYLDEIGYGRYKLKAEFDTQRKVADYFALQEKSEKNIHISNALLSLIDEVLFIEDPYEKGKYHPRIAAHSTYIYRSLTDYEKWCFNRLYNDFYYHRHNDFWYGKAMWKLPPLVDATSMLCCAEDLGMVPDCVAAVMSQLEILSLEIQRMPKDPKIKFGNTWGYPYYSVCTTSTHDMGGIRQWWEEDRDKTQEFFNHVLGEPGLAPQYAEPWICDKIVTNHLASPSMLCILPLQDWLSIDGDIRRTDPREEQINVPANPTHYWRYRMHMTVDELRNKKAFNNRLLEKIRVSGR